MSTPFKHCVGAQKVLNFRAFQILDFWIQDAKPIKKEKKDQTPQQQKVYKGH